MNTASDRLDALLRGARPPLPPHLRARVLALAEPIPWWRRSRTWLVAGLLLAAIDAALIPGSKHPQAEPRRDAPPDIVAQLPVINRYILPTATDGGCLSRTSLAAMVLP